MFQVASLWTETRLTSVLGGLQLYKHSFESQPSLESSWDIIIIIIPMIILRCDDNPACTLGTLGITSLPISYHHLHPFHPKNTIKAGGSTAICKMLTGVGDGVDTP